MYVFALLPPDAPRPDVRISPCRPNSPYPGATRSPPWPPHAAIPTAEWTPTAPDLMLPLHFPIVSRPSSP